MMLHGKKLICFDLDGTLIDSVGIWNQVDAALILQLAGLNTDETEIQRQRDEQLQTFRHLADPYLAYCGFLQQKYAFARSAEEVKACRYQISRQFLDTAVQPKMHVRELLQQLKQNGLLLALTTTTSLFNIQRYQQFNTNVNTAIDFANDFDLVLTRDNVQNIKPHPEIYLNAMAHFKLRPEECLIIEDSLIGVEAAVQAGIEAVAVYDEYSASEQEQIKSKAAFYIQDLAALTAAAKLAAIN